jgi:hypothetical protein
LNLPRKQGAILFSLTPQYVNRTFELDRRAKIAPFSSTYYHRKMDKQALEELRS